MSGCGEVGDQRLHPGGEVVVDRTGAARCVEQDDGDARGHRCALGRGVDQDPGGAEPLEAAHVGVHRLRAALGDGQHELEAVTDGVPDAADDLGEERVRQVGRDEHHEVAAAARQGARRVVHDVAELLDGVPHPVGDRCRDPPTVLAVDDEGDRGDARAGAFGHHRGGHPAGRSGATARGRGHTSMLATLADAPSVRLDVKRLMR
ncbi:hypothetical protein DEJ36_11610 [Curtobacterium sp. MCPF17_052]|nr:hypothetical protein [Curtobacterium sp. MCPF17_052]WIB11602.1 hypothetical protein DEJ36_11610 [Curtobacterium sp. MCPF17_052]